MATKRTKRSAGKTRQAASARAAAKRVRRTLRPARAKSATRLRRRNAAITAISVVTRGSTREEFYETRSGGARRRAEQLRRLGYKVTSSSVGKQTTSRGQMFLTKLSISGGSGSIPAVRVANRHKPRAKKVANRRDARARRNAFGLDRFIGRKPRTTATTYQRAGEKRRAAAYAKAGVPKKLMAHYTSAEWKDLQQMDPAFVKKVMKSLNPKERARLRKKLNGRGRRNPDGNGAQAAADSYAMFHGRGPSQTVKVKAMVPGGDMASLGDLTELRLGDGSYGIKWKQRDKNAPLLAMEAGSPDQLYIVGGDQCLGEELLRSLGVSSPVDVVDFGEVAVIEYFTQKDFDGFQPIRYFHHFGEEDAAKNPRLRRRNAGDAAKVRRPRLLYSRRYKKLMLAGGAYKIRKDGIIN